MSEIHGVSLTDDEYSSLVMDAAGFRSARDSIWEIRQIFAANGIDPRTNWPEWIALVRKLSAQAGNVNTEHKGK